jgi:hypothetical protein
MIGNWLIMKSRRRLKHDRVFDVENNCYVVHVNMSRPEDKRL